LSTAIIVAERELEYITPKGTIVRIPIKLSAPEGSDKHWSCRFTIGWPDGIEDSAAYGVDQIQALVLTLQMIGGRIYFSDYHKSGRLQFEKPGSGYGFPVPKNARDLLVGDDKRFDG
jgi:hypothetical protein